MTNLHIAQRVLDRHLNRTSCIKTGSLDVTVDNAETVLQTLLENAGNLDQLNSKLGIDLRNMTKLMAELKHNDNIHHTGETIIEHTKWVLADLEKLTEGKDATTKQMLSLVALLHDVGKAYTREIQPNGKITFYKHAEKSVAIAQVLLAKYKDQLGQTYQRILDLIRLHDMFHAIANDRKNQVPGATKYLRRLLQESIYLDKHLDELVIFAKADSARSKAAEEYLKHIDDALADIALAEKLKAEQEVARARQQANIQRKLPEIRKLLEVEAPGAAQALPNVSKANAILGQAKQYDLIKQIRAMLGP